MKQRYSQKVKDAVVEEMDLVARISDHSTVAAAPLCAACNDMCENCPWDHFVTDGCLDVFTPRSEFSREELELLACMLAAVAGVDL